MVDQRGGVPSAGALGRLRRKPGPLTCVTEWLGSRYFQESALGPWRENRFVMTILLQRHLISRHLHGSRVCVQSSERQKYTILEGRAGVNITGTHKPVRSTCGGLANLKVVHTHRHRGVFWDIMKCLQIIAAVVCRYVDMGCDFLDRNEWLHKVQGKLELLRHAQTRFACYILISSLSTLEAGQSSHSGDKAL